ncbi:MAG: MMPL family transporter [Planctomycetaceae bacterium]
MTNPQPSQSSRTGKAVLVAAMLAFAVPLLVMGIRHLRLDNNVESWLPANDSEATIFNWYRKHFHEEDRVVVTWRGSTIDDPRCDELIGKLLGHVDADGLRRGGVPYISSVVSSRDVLTRMVGYGVPQEEAIRRMEGTLIGLGRLKIRMTDAGREQRERTITQLVKRVRAELGVQLGVHDPVRTATEDTPRGETEIETTAATDSEPAETVVITPIEIPEYDFEVGWKEFSPHDPLVAKVQTIARDLRGFATAKEPQGRILIDDCFIAPGSPVAVAVTLSEAGRADASSTLAAIRTAASQVGIPEQDLILGGRSVATMELNNSVVRAAWNKSAPLWKLHERSVMLLSGLVGVVLAIVSLRSVRLALMVLGVSYYGAFVSTALVPLTGGSMNMVLMVLPTFVMVVSLSGAIHVANYISHATLENPNGAVERATKLAMLPCFNSVCTTVLGLLSLLTSSLKPVRDFGIYSSIGATLTLLMVLVVLPSLLKLFPTKGVRQPESDVRRWLGYSHFLMRFSRPIHLACWVVGLAATAGLVYFQTETKVIRNFADDTRLIRDYRFIEENLAGISTVETVIKFDQASQKSLRFLQRMEVVRQVAEGIRKNPNVSGAVCLADFQPTREAPDNSANTRDKVMYNRRSVETEKRIKTANSADIRAYLSVAQEAADLKQPGDCQLNTAGEELWRITAQVPALADVNYVTLTEDLNQAVQSVTKYHPGVGHVVTGTVPLFMRTQQALLDSLIQSFALAFLTIALVMMYALKDVIAGMLSMIPNVLPILAVFGAVSWARTRIDIGTMITASVALGLAVDACLHLMTWFRKGLEKGLSRDEAIIECLVHCGPAMLQTTAGISLAMLVLYPSDLVMISRFGWLMAALIAAAYVGDIVLLPVMLRGALGRRIEKAVLEERRLAALAAEAIEDTCIPEVVDLQLTRQDHALVEETIPAPHLPLDKARTRRKRNAS